KSRAETRERYEQGEGDDLPKHPRQEAQGAQVQPRRGGTRGAASRNFLDPPYQDRESEKPGNGRRPINGAKIVAGQHHETDRDQRAQDRSERKQGLTQAEPAAAQAARRDVG